MYSYIVLSTHTDVLLSNAGGGPNIDGVNAIAHDTVIKLTGLIPDTKYLVTVKAENKLYGMDNTTSRSESISVTLLEGGMLQKCCDNTQQIAQNTLRALGSYTKREMRA